MDAKKELKELIIKMDERQLEWFIAQVRRALREGCMPPAHLSENPQTNTARP